MKIKRISRIIESILEPFFFLITGTINIWLISSFNEIITYYYSIALIILVLAKSVKVFFIEEDKKMKGGGKKWA